MIVLEVSNHVTTDCMEEMELGHVLDFKKHPISLENIFI